MNKYLIKNNVAALASTEDIELLNIEYVSIRGYIIAPKDGEYNGQEVKAGDIILVPYDGAPFILERSDPYSQYLRKVLEERLKERNENEPCCDCCAKGVA